MELDKNPDIGSTWHSAVALITFVVETLILSAEILIRTGPLTRVSLVALVCLVSLAILNGLMISHYFSKFLPTMNELRSKLPHLAVGYAKLFWLATVGSGTVALVAALIIRDFVRPIR